MFSLVKVLCYVLIFSIEPSHETHSEIICGNIVETSSDEPLVGVLIVVDSVKSVLSDQDGGFCIEVAIGSSIIIQHIGYKTLVIDSVEDLSSLYTIRLAQISEVLPEVTIVSKGHSHKISEVASPIKDLSFLPKLLGEADPIRILSFYPGVSTGAEGTSGLYVRGGDPDQNLYLLDDVPLYNTNHFFGFLSVVNPSSVKAVNLMKGHIPSSYGGRASSIIQITSKEGNRNELKGQYSFGLITNTAALEGPLLDGKASFSMSSRIANLSLITFPGVFLFNGDAIDNYASYNMYDINGKLTYDISDKTKISTSFYAGQDRIPLWDRDGGEISKRLNRYGNLTGSIRLRTFARNNWVHTATAYVTDYQYGDEFRTFMKSDDNSVLLSQSTDRSDLTDIGLKYKNRIDLKQGLAITSGIDITWLKTRPNEVTVEERGENDGQLTKYIADPLVNSLFQFAPFGSIAYDKNRWRADLGMRLNYYDQRSSTSVILEPRAAITYDLSNSSSLELSYTALSQPLHLLISPTMGLPSDTWVVSDEAFPPSTSMNFSLDGRKLFQWGELRFASFYRTFNDLVDYRRGVKFRFDPASTYVSKIIGGGDGRAIGLEVFLEATMGKAGFQIGTTVSRSERRFEVLSDGNWVRNRFDKLVDITLNATIKLSETHILNSTVVFNTGFPITIPSHYYVTQFRGIEPAYTERSNAQSPNYFRLDLQLTKEYETKNKKQGYWSIGFYNALFTVNPNVVAFDGNFRITEDGLANGSFISKYKRSYFTFIPSMTIGRRF